MPKYHSALHPPSGSIPLERADLGKRGVAFLHDLTLGYRAEFDPCDVFYAEIPWSRGQSNFNIRAGGGPKWEDVVRAAAFFVPDGRPLILIAGKETARRKNLLPPRSAEIPCLLSAVKGPAVAYFFNCDPPARLPEELTNVKLLDALAGTHACVGDFACGYGLAGRRFLRAGKRCVLSDYNPECVGYIYSNWRKWT